MYACNSKKHWQCMGSMLDPIVEKWKSTANKKAKTKTNQRSDADNATKIKVCFISKFLFFSPSSHVTRKQSRSRSAAPPWYTSYKDFRTNRMAAKSIYNGCYMLFTHVNVGHAIDRPKTICFQPRSLYVWMTPRCAVYRRQYALIKMETFLGFRH
jgi:hypothetical protein